MSLPSPPELRILHAVRLLGFADVSDLAIRARAAREETSAVLAEAVTRGWVVETSFADLGGWSLTEQGRAENERRLAREREQADPQGRIAAVHRGFLPLNSRLLRACTRWQVRPVAQDPLAPNDHRDRAWDEDVLAELTAIGEGLAPLEDRLVAVLSRFAGYRARFVAALQRAQAGQHDWIDRSHLDSCHRVWFELHEDLVATLGIDRSDESTADPA